MTTPAHRAGKLQLELSEDQARTLVRALGEHVSMIAGDPGDMPVTELLVWVTRRVRRRFGPEREHDMSEKQDGNDDDNGDDDDQAGIEAVREAGKRAWQIHKSRQGNGNPDKK